MSQSVSQSIHIPSLDLGQIGKELFLKKNFNQTAMAISTLAMLLFSPFALITGIIVGFIGHRFIDSLFKQRQVAPIVSIWNTSVAIVGAVASFVRMTPIGWMGGFVFHSLPFLCALSVGSSAYKAYAETKKFVGF